VFSKIKKKKLPGAHEPPASSDNVGRRVYLFKIKILSEKIFQKPPDQFPNPLFAMSASSIGVGVAIAALALLLVIFLISKSVYIVQQSEAIVIERLGRFHRVLASGLHFVVPFVDSPKIFTWRRTELSASGQVAWAFFIFFSYVLKSALNTSTLEPCSVSELVYV
jgi:hypothetical protein